MQDFKGKVAVITGGASGIGRAIAERLGREGVKLVLADIEKPALLNTVGELRASGLDAYGHVTDVSRYEDVAALADRAFTEFGGVHLLFSNAGVVTQEAANLWDISLNTWNWYLNVNFWGVLHGIKAFMPRLIQQNQEAFVVNVTSHAGGLLNHPIIPAYCVSKSAMASVTENLHFQLRALNSPVKAMLLFPGPHTVPTNTYTSARNRPSSLPPDPSEPVSRVATLEQMQQKMLQDIGRRRDTTPAEEVAEQVLQALREDRYWVLPMSDRFEAAMEAHHRMVMDRTGPEMPHNVL